MVRVAFQWKCVRHVRISFDVGMYPEPAPQAANGRADTRQGALQLLPSI